MYYTCIQPSAEYRVNTLYSDPWQPKSGFNGFRSRTGSRNLPWCWGGGEACTPARRMADELRRVVTQHTGADFEAGRVGHRNGPQIAGTEHEVSDGTQPEDNAAPRDRGPAGTGLATNQGQRTRPPAKAMPKRAGPVWATVDIVGTHYETTPQVKCKDCGISFSGGLTRIEDHIVGKT